MSFFKQESGVQSLLKSMLPPEIYNSILDAAKKVPAIIENVQAAMVSIDARLETIQENQDLILYRLERCEMKLDPSFAPETALTTLNERVTNGEQTDEDLELMKNVPVTGIHAIQNTNPLDPLDSRLTDKDIALLDAHPPETIN